MMKDINIQFSGKIYKKNETGPSTVPWGTPQERVADCLLNKYNSWRIFLHIRLIFCSDLIATPPHLSKEWLNCNKNRTLFLLPLLCVTLPVSQLWLWEYYHSLSSVTTQIPFIFALSIHVTELFFSDSTLLSFSFSFSVSPGHTIVIVWSQDNLVGDRALILWGDIWILYV